MTEVLLAFASILCIVLGALLLRAFGRVSVLHSQLREALQRLQDRDMEYAKREKAARQDAINRSARTRVGKALEQLMPFMKDFPYDPRDVKFMGAPVDLIVFDGMDDKDVPIRQVVFVELKSGTTAQLTGRQRQIRQCIQDGHVRWQVMKASQ